VVLEILPQAFLGRDLSAPCLEADLPLGKRPADRIRFGLMRQVSNFSCQLLHFRILDVERHGGMVPFFHQFYQTRRGPPAATL